ncbi:MAG TPA: hypothetical protein VL069_08645, partial [Opitutus sp.]|nr:hypothetical protein [Opitutus sp.]
TVIAILSVMVAILIPTVSSSREAAAKTRTRVQFNQWAVAIASFRSEYGYYPLFDASYKVNGGADEVNHLFHDVLAGRKRNGAALSTGSPAASQNKKQISFCSFSEADFTGAGSATPNLLQDGFGETDIAVLVDRNLDGVINPIDYGETLPAVSGIRPNATDFPADGIRAGVVFYCAAPRATVDAPQFIFSWK